jgi:hypothetical protein
MHSVNDKLKLDAPFGPTASTAVKVWGETMTRMGQAWHRRHFGAHRHRVGKPPANSDI